MNATAIVSAVDLEPFTNFSPIFAYLISQVARRAPSLLEQQLVIDAFLALYTSKIVAFVGDAECLARDSSRMTMEACLNAVRHIAYPAHDKEALPVWPHIDAALRDLLILPRNAHVLRILRLRLRYAWDIRVALDDRLTEDHPDAGEPFEFMTALARFVLVLNRRAS